MLRQALPLATGLMTVLGIWLAGNKNKLGWQVGIANQALWLWFIIAFQAWGLMPLLVSLLFVYTRNLLKWNAEEKTGA